MPGLGFHEELCFAKLHWDVRAASGHSSLAQGRQRTRGVAPISAPKPPGLLKALCPGPCAIQPHPPLVASPVHVLSCRAGPE
ncbi:hypothetical protein VULLAG_LOCUS11104 [Vulpes lagopus]